MPEILKRTTFIGQVLGLFAFAGVVSAQPSVNIDTPSFRGVTIGPIESSLQPARGYGTDASAQTLDELKKLGVTWISITPFGRLWSLQSTTIKRDFEAPYEINRKAVRSMIEQAHERGIKVLVIPHLWVERGGWRGEIDPGSPRGWKKYIENYRRFVVDWAKDAESAQADAFSVGVECKSWSGRFGKEWRKIIADVRTEFSGLLTYSSNWDEAENVLFWDQLDFVGINAFYPLATHNNASEEEYRSGARKVAATAKELSETLQLPIVFVEVGYTTRKNAAVEPWLWPDHMHDVVVDEREQARALNAVLTTFLEEPWFAGFFVWRYYAYLDDVSQEAPWGFSPHGKLAEDVLRQAFKSSWSIERSQSTDLIPEH